jgi:hypothetical protein
MTSVPEQNPYRLFQAPMQGCIPVASGIRLQQFADRRVDRHSNVFVMAIKACGCFDAGGVLALRKFPQL